jgi:hypothetical protein
MKKILPVSLAALFLFGILGCATLFNQEEKEVGFSSDPEGAKVYINGSFHGETPVNVQLKKDKEYTVEFRKEGYQTKTAYITNKVGAGWIILDVLGGLIPIVIDAATGEWYELETDYVKVVLE